MGILEVAEEIEILLPLPVFYIYDFVSFLCYLLPVIEEHEIETDDDERNAQPLSHVEHHVVFECFLVLLHEFDKETEGKDISQTEAEEESAMQFLAVILIKIDHDEEQDQISYRFIELSRMTGKHIYPFEYECQGTSVGLPIISEFIRFARRMKQAVIGVATAIMSTTSI